MEKSGVKHIIGREKNILHEAHKAEKGEKEKSGHFEQKQNEIIVVLRRNF